MFGCGEVAEFIEYRKRLFDEMTQREDDLMARFKQTVPESLGRWYEEGGRDIVREVLKNGRHHAIYYDGEVEDEYMYDVGVLKDFAQLLNDLGKSWEAVINIRVEWENDWLINVIFEAVKSEVA